jgi:cytochrome c biogenesis protein CcdA
MTVDLAGIAGVFLLGVSVGLTACAVSCLPFIGTWAFARAGGGWAGAEDLAAFLAGRLAGYAVLGGMAGMAGEALARALNGPSGHIAIGTAGVIAGLSLAWRARKHSVCRAAGSGLPPFAMGAALSLTPCAPLGSLLAAAALAGNAPGGAVMGLVFGLGAAVTPLMVAVPLLGLFGRGVAAKAGLERWLRLGGAGVLVALGLRRLALVL